MTNIPRGFWIGKKQGVCVVLNQFFKKLVTLFIFAIGVSGKLYACDECPHKSENHADAQSVVEVVPTEHALASKVEVAPELPQDKEQAVAALPVEVIEFVLTNKVEGREPQKILENFHNQDGKAYAFARLNAKEHAQVTFVWLYEGKEQARFTSNVQTSKRWRTFSSVQLKPGKWTAQLIAKGQVIAERDFVVSE